jgi:plastocyanin
MRSIKRVGLVVATALLVAGCGGGGGGAMPWGGGRPSGPTAPTTLEPGTVSEGRVVIDITELEFVPDKLTIPAETQVIWTNSDDVEHGVKKTDGPGPGFDSGPIKAGATFSQVFDQTGDYTISDQETQADQEPMMTIVVEEKDAAEPAPGGAPPPQPGEPVQPGAPAPPPGA